MIYNPSIWDSELDKGRRDYVYSILQSATRPMKLRELARSLCLVSRETEMINAIDDCTIFHNSRFRRTLTQDIHEMNFNMDFPKIIIHSGDGMKLATKEEAKMYIEAQYKEAIRKMMLAQKMAKKLSLEDQISLEQITEAKELENVETYG